MKAILALADGKIFTGEAFGASGEVEGEAEELQLRIALRPPLLYPLTLLRFARMTTGTRIAISYLAITQASPLPCNPYVPQLDAVINSQVPPEWKIKY